MWAAAITLLAQAAISAYGAHKAGKMSKAQLWAQRDQLARIAGIPLPALEEMAAEELGPSAMESVSTDPILRQKQMDTLAKFSELANQGFDAQEQADTERMMQRIGGDLNARRASILGQMAARGNLDSNASLAAQLAAQQGASQNMYSTGMDLRAQNLSRRFQALQQQGALAGNIRQQDWGEQSQVAQARDAISRYNNAARNAARQYNIQLSQRNFENQMAKANAMGGVSNNISNIHGQQAQNDLAFWGNLGASAANMGMNYYNAQTAQANAATARANGTPMPSAGPTTMPSGMVTAAPPVAVPDMRSSVVATSVPTIMPDNATRADQYDWRDDDESFYGGRWS